MTQKKVKKGPGRPRNMPYKPQKTPRIKRAFLTPLDKIMLELKELHKKGEIQSLTENPHLINANHEYTYIGFKIPKTEVKE